MHWEIFAILPHCKPKRNSGQLCSLADRLVYTIHSYFELSRSTPTGARSGIGMFSASSAGLARFI